MLLGSLDNRYVTGDILDRKRAVDLDVLNCPKIIVKDKAKKSQFFVRTAFNS